MKSKLGAALVCLLFAVPFGGVGAGASWVLVRMLQDGHRAQEWVRAKATVESYGQGKVDYRYRFNGVEYRGNRLGANPIGGTDDIDSWHDDMNAMLSAAQSGEKPLTVWVNPENPSESMVDREIRWKLVLFTIPFALGFGGVGLGALYVMVRTLFARSSELEAEPDPLARVQAGGGTGVFGIWVFAFFWNVISFPIAFLAVPDAVANGEWLVLLVLIFPLIGVLLLWGAINSTLAAIRARFARNDAALPVVPVASHRADGFARGMIDDPRAAAADASAIDTMDDGLPAPPDPMLAELEKLSGKKLTEQQRAELAKMDPKVRAMMTKVAGWVGKMKVPQ